MDPVHPQPRIRHPLVRVETQDALDLRAYVLFDDVLEPSRDIPDVHDRRKLLEEGSIP
jgi:hypothetical protein